ncbi:DUF6093 family protein [Streptomyces sp. NRRL F-5135]|uniref:DUF6093 family protein n=1 Tax=Streptomyces sp. NRRL F-5135 TaxID=1463858 RepID=UPI0004C7E059|nr:DUF6093 family protein [Streptomyces sp. NRRL F-5135]
MPGLDRALAGVTRWFSTNILIDTVRITLPATTEPVLNTSTGNLEYPEGAVLYEGPGAVFNANAAAEISATPDVQQPWIQETKSRYQLYTPLDAPVAPKDAVVTVTAVHDPARSALLGRAWTCPDPGQAATVEIARRTPLDQIRIPGGAT